MKAKLNFDSAVIKEFFREHWEKFVFAGGLIVLFLFISSVFRGETLPEDLRPKQIASISRSVIENVNRAPFDSASIKLTDVPGPIAPLPTQQLAAFHPFIMPDGPFADPHKRADPNLYAPVALQAFAMRGALATIPDPNSSAAPRPGTIVPGGAVPRGIVPGGIVPGGIVPGGRTRGGLVPGGLVPGSLVPGAGTARRGQRIANNTVVNPKAGPGGLVPGLVPGGMPANEGPQPLNGSVKLPGAVASGSAEARDWVILTAALPVEQQQKEYNQRFAHARRAEAGAVGPLDRRAPRSAGRARRAAICLVAAGADRSDRWPGKDDHRIWRRAADPDRPPRPEHRDRSGEQDAQGGARIRSAGGGSSHLARIRRRGGAGGLSGGCVALVAAAADPAARLGP